MVYSKRLKFMGFVLIFGQVLGCAKPTVRDFDPPAKTDWRPVGLRQSLPTQNAAIPEPLAFQTMHGGINNSDHLWIAAAPMFELDWVAEAAFFVPEGPTFDRQGNLYFSPLFPQENVSLVSLYATTGERRWAIPGDGVNAGGGATLVLDDPAQPSRDMIFHATYEEAMALTPDGTVLWRTPTGLEFATLSLDETPNVHVFGLNYHPTTDSILGVTANGFVFAMDRATGESRGALMRLPGAPAPASNEAPADWIVAIGDRETDKAFGKIAGTESFFSVLTNAIFGGGAQVTNFYGVDPHSGLIYVAATAPDGDDGVEDGVSALGALYLMDLVAHNDGYRFEILRYRTFEGGTGSTPSISDDGQSVVVSDSDNNVIAFDRDLNELWRFRLNEQVAASVAIAPDNHELYAVTRKNVYQLLDQGDHAELGWVADLDAYERHGEFNALTPTITANGVVVSIGAGYFVQGQELMLSVGMGLLDRHTGKLRYFSEGREESIAISSVNQEGALYVAHSPVRRAVAHGLLPRQTPELVGGIARFKPVRHDLLVRDAVCAALHRVQRLSDWQGQQPLAALDESGQIRALLQQASRALTNAAGEGDLSPQQAGDIDALLASASAAAEAQDLAAAEAAMAGVCELFP